MQARRSASDAFRASSASAFEEAASASASFRAATARSRSRRARLRLSAASRAAARSFVADARRWWEGSSLDVRVDASFGARAMGVAVRVNVPELAVDAQTLGEAAKKEPEAKTVIRADNGECACLAGACQFGSAVPGAGKAAGEACVLGAQCESSLCGWDFKCAEA